MKSHRHRVPEGATVIGLQDLPSRVPARVVGLRAELSGDEREVALRLLEIGFLRDEPVQVMAHGSPGRDPLAVRVGRSTFALRRHEASLVEVQVLDGVTPVRP